ncbi:MAG: amidohydrolase family protein [Firmicutes bacterium]|nr:amidohydrolase family protein [Bacillota bacterium]
MNEKRVFKNWRALAELDYFELLDDGRLALVVPELDNLIDFHTHLGWTVLLAPKVDVLKETPEILHNFEADLELDLDVYMGQNFHDVRPNWGVEDYVPCALYPWRGGKHHTHTIPNLIREMDALKIDISVSLSLDIFNSYNSRRFGQAMRFNPRLVFYCCVHPGHKRREALIDEYLALGARGMKLHPEMQLQAVSTPQMISLMKLWQKKSGGMPILAHSGFNGFEPKVAREHADIKHFWVMAETLDESPCILGHAAMNYYREATEIAEKFPNVYLEVSGQPKKHLLEILDRIGPDRLLFGTDWPIYPQAISLAKVLLATEGEPEARIKILRDNARKLLDRYQE